jgi:hypothetical protein
MTHDGETIGVSTLRADQVRQAHADEIAHDPSPVFVPVLMRELGNSPRGVSEGGA